LYWSGDTSSVAQGGSFNFTYGQAVAHGSYCTGSTCNLAYNFGCTVPAGGWSGGGYTGGTYVPTSIDYALTVPLSATLGVHVLGCIGAINTPGYDISVFDWYVTVT
jgi:hypothetical protein